jgi:hypothetical protein
MNTGKLYPFKIAMSHFMIQPANVEISKFLSFGENIRVPRIILCGYKDQQTSLKGSAIREFVLPIVVSFKQKWCLR